MTPSHWLGVILGMTVLGTAQAQTHTYKDWAVACDNTRHCEAMGYQSEDSTLPPVVLWLARDAGANAPVTLMLDSEDGHDKRTATLRIGKFTLQGVAWGKALDPGQTRQLLEQLVRGDEASLSDGTTQWKLSLAGANAALLKMDDVQGRVGTPGALVRKGQRAEASVLPSLAPPTVRAAPLPQAQASDEALLQPILKAIKPRECFDDLPDDQNPEQSITRVSSSQVLVMRECLRGAYQGSSGLWLANIKAPHSPRRLTLPTASGESIDVVTNASFDNGHLNAYSKSRGLNDCGRSAQWTWTGKAFVLAAANEAPLCRGLPLGGFSLQTWTTQNAP